MQTIETTATVDEDLRHLSLTTPLSHRPAGEVKVLLLLPDDQPAAANSQPVDFRDSIGLLRRLFPDSPHRTTAEWMKELREGEED